jgi:hypothetical protein
MSLLDEQTNEALQSLPVTIATELSAVLSG